MSATDTSTTQLYRVYIKAAPQAIWDAITSPEWTERFGYGGRASFDLRPGGTFVHYASDEMKKGAPPGVVVPDVIVDGEVIECDPPRKLVQTWRMMMDPQGPEGFTRLEYEIAPLADGTCRLTVTHDLKGAPRLAVVVAGEMEEQGAGGGWAWVLSDLKSLIETGKSFRDK